FSAGTFRLRRRPPRPLPQPRVDRLQRLRSRAQVGLGQGVERGRGQVQAVVQGNRFLVEVDQAGDNLAFGAAVFERRQRGGTVAAIVVVGELVQADRRAVVQRDGLSAAGGIVDLDPRPAAD